MTLVPTVDDDGIGTQPDVTVPVRRSGSGVDGFVQDILEVLPAAIYTTDARGCITFYNRAAAELWGVHPELGRSEFCGSWKLYQTDGTPLPHDKCPMALAIRERRAVRGAEAVAERPDGVRVPFLACPTPLFDHAGNLAGAVNMLIDLSDRKSADVAAQRLVAIVESSDDAILAADLNGTIISWNRAAERLFGYKAQEAIGEPLTLLIPRDRQDEEPNILARIRRGEHVKNYETVRRRKDGSLVEISLTVSPLKDADGRIVGASKIARDISDRRRAEQQQQLLIREMDHRVKNVFALASSLVNLSARRADTPAELAASVTARLSALARAHAITVPTRSSFAGRTEQSTTLHALVATILAPYEMGGRPHARATITGPDVSLTGGAVTSFALLLHEFATNAAKHGCLSTCGGHIDIACSENEQDYVLEWSERGGPPTQPPLDDEGFGTVLSRATARNQLGGSITRTWRPEGLQITLAVPRIRLRS